MKVKIKGTKSVKTEKMINKYMIELTDGTKAMTIEKKITRVFWLACVRGHIMDETTKLEDLFKVIRVNYYKKCMLLKVYSGSDYDEILSELLVGQRGDSEHNISDADVQTDYSDIVFEKDGIFTCVNNPISPHDVITTTDGTQYFMIYAKRINSDFRLVFPVAQNKLGLPKKLTEDHEFHEFKEYTGDDDDVFKELLNAVDPLYLTQQVLKADL